MSLETVGQIIDQIPVEISYKIIELFSAGLYSSPNKAFEELVSNSYDADATKVCVHVPLDKSLPNSILWVADNGISMDADGLKLFWKIGTSTKRDTQIKNRLPIGKFGIGKLATYILTQKLTLVCKSLEAKYYAVTMNYSEINKDSADKITLNERELTLDEVKSIISPLIINSNTNLLSFKLWGENAERSWTFAIMSDLKTKAADIKDGRLKWILRTALPLNPNFKLFFNGELLESSKVDISPWKTWVIGKDEKVTKKYKYETSQYNNQPCVNLPTLKNITGQVDLYKESLVKGKSEDWGRSNGIFLTIRGRLINIDDPLIGMQAMSHGVFNRVRILVQANGLDDYITSTRESIKESVPFNELKQYIQRKFEEVKEWYFAQIEEEEEKNRASYKITSTSASLSRRPLIVAAKKFFNNEISNLVLTDIPINLNTSEKEKFIERLEEELTGDKGIIKNVEWIALRPEDPVAKLDLFEGIAKVNLMHPFFANFIDEVKSPLPFQLIALTEILTEVILIEAGIDQDNVRRIMWQRDSILRELTFSDKPNAPFVASLLQASLADSSGLEGAVTQAFNSLGFETTPIGGNGKPDGKAVAYIRHLNAPENYSVTFDAKSTSKNRIKAATAHISGVNRHRIDYRSDFACVVSIDYEGADDPNSSVNKEAKTNKINLVRAKDLMTLVLISSPKQIGLGELRDFFEHCHTVIETSNWIKTIREKQVNRGPIKELLETIFELNKTDTEPTYISVIRRENDILKTHSIDYLKSLIESLERLVPGYISLTNDIVSIQVSPDKILKAINQTFSDVPPEFREIYLKAFDA